MIHISEILKSPHFTGLVRGVDIGLMPLVCVLDMQLEVNHYATASDYHTEGLCHCYCYFHSTRH